MLIIRSKHWTTIKKQCKLQNKMKYDHWIQRYNYFHNFYQQIPDTAKYWKYRRNIKRAHCNNRKKIKTYKDKK